MTTVLTFLTFFIACLLSYAAGSIVMVYMISPTIDRLEAEIRELRSRE